MMKRLIIVKFEASWSGKDEIEGTVFTFNANLDMAWKIPHTTARMNPFYNSEWLLHPFHLLMLW